MSKNEYLTFYFQRSGTGNDCDDGFPTESYLQAAGL